MGKKRGHPDVEELLSRAWCYYCERDFEDLKLLISHQKAKHFKCDRCGRRLNTAGGLSVHLNQVHKESLTQVENALPNRQGLDVEIFGMEGIPEDIIQQHNTRIIQNFYQTQAERQAATGNPPPGAQGAMKKIKVESKDELKSRFADFKARKAAQKAAGLDQAAVANVPAQSASPGTFAPPYAAPPPQQQQQQQQQPGMEFAQGYPPPSGYGAYPPSALPTRPGSIPGSGAIPSQYPPQGAAAAGDDIDQLIRMAEAGIKPPPKSADSTTGLVAQDASAAEKKGKKDKDKSRMIYSDSEISPEEKMATFARYTWVVAAV